MRSCTIIWMIEPPWNHIQERQEIASKMYIGPRTITLDFKNNVLPKPSVGVHSCMLCYEVLSLQLHRIAHIVMHVNLAKIIGARRCRSEAKQKALRRKDHKRFIIMSLCNPNMMTLMARNAKESV